jgi:hypothetical protein
MCWGVGSPARKGPQEAHKDGHIQGPAHPGSASTILDPDHHRASGGGDAAPCTDPPHSRCLRRQSRLDCRGDRCGLGHQRVARASGAPSLCRTGLGGGVVPPAADRPAVSPAGRGPGRAADRLRRPCAPCRPSTVDTAVMGGQVGAAGCRRPPPCGVGASHAPNNDRNPWRQQPWVLPPHAQAEWIWARADVLAVYTRPDDPQRPPGCSDATSTPLGADTRRPIPAAPGPPERGDDEDERQGTAQRCLVCAPVAGQRRVKVPAAAHGGGLRPSAPPGGRGAGPAGRDQRAGQGPPAHPPAGVRV